MQGTWVRSLVQEDPTCHRATKPMRHNYWTCALQPTSHNYWALAPQLLKPLCPRACVPQLLSPCAATTGARAPRAPCSATREVTTMRSLCTAMKSNPLSPQLEKACAQQRRPNAAKKTKQNKRIKRRVHDSGQIQDQYTVSSLHTNIQVESFQRCERASGSSKEPEPVPSTSGMSEIAACPPSPVADDPSALPSPTSSPSSSQ